MNRNLVKRGFASFLKPKSSWKPPVRVAVTGANGNIGYANIFRVASGEMLGPDQPVILHLLDIPAFEEKLTGSIMELDDCAFPLLKDVIKTSDPKVAFKDIDYGLLIGSKPRGPGMERKDLLLENAKIFIEQGRALDSVAKKTTKILVVGNPANTNCLILSHYCQSLPRENFTAMSRLDHDRGLGMIAKKLACDVDEIDNFCVWGNHSPTMYPDTTHVSVKGKDATFDGAWLRDKFIPGVQKRGGAIIAARGLSSAASASNAAIAHMRDWHTGTNGKWVSKCVISNGEYDITKGLVYSYPVTVDNGKWKIVEGIKVNEESRQYMKHTENELLEEREAIKDLLK